MKKPLPCPMVALLLASSALSGYGRITFFAKFGAGPVRP